MAPEVLGGKQYDEKVDSYSFGIVMYEVKHNLSLMSIRREVDILSVSAVKYLTKRQAWTR